MLRTSLLSTPRQFGPVSFRDHFRCLQIFSIKFWQKRPYEPLENSCQSNPLTFFWYSIDFVTTFCLLSIHFLSTFCSRPELSLSIEENEVMNPQAMTVKAKQPEGPTVAEADVIDKGLFHLISQQPKTKCKIPNSRFMHQIFKMGLQWGTVVFRFRHSVGQSKFLD